MKTITFLLLTFPTFLGAQKSIKNPTLVQAACGQCQFQAKGKGCDLAIRYRGQVYFVDGSNIDEHGDAHAKNGFCNAIRKAEVTGSFKRKRFVAKTFKVMD